MKKLFILGIALVSLICSTQAEEKVEGSTGDIRWGQHWAGPELRGAKSLEGKVVLLKIWGS